jgi:hypothetical protein
MFCVSLRHLCEARMRPCRVSSRPAASCFCAVFAVLSFNGVYKTPSSLVVVVLFVFCLQDADLRDAAALLQQALNAETVQQEEALWTQVSGRLGSPRSSSNSSSAAAADWR